jgi:glutaredoxin
MSGQSADDRDQIPVTVYTKDPCPLCVEAVEAVEQVATDAGISIDLALVDVETDAELAAEYGDRVPYGFVDGQPAFKYTVDERSLRLQLLAAT